MKRDPFDERCTCGHEEQRPGRRRMVCVCVKHVYPPRERCTACMEGRHVMRRAG